MQVDKTSLIIPCYFADESFVKMTSDCLESLKYGRPSEVIMVNDGSPLSSIWVWGADSQINLRDNHGYATAVNTGLRAAHENVLIVSNNDIIFTPGWLEALLKPLHEGYDISSIVTSDSGYTTEDKITEGDKFGSLWAMKRKVYDTLGGLDESFGNYFEDLDYRRRAIIAGFKIGKNHAGLVEHEGKATFKVVDPEDKLYYAAQAKYLDKWRHLPNADLADDFKGDPNFAYLLAG